MERLIARYWLQNTSRANFSHLRNYALRIPHYILNRPADPPTQTLFSTTFLYICQSNHYQKIDPHTRTFFLALLPLHPLAPTDRVIPPRLLCFLSQMSFGHGASLSFCARSPGAVILAFKYACASKVLPGDIYTHIKAQRKVSGVWVKHSNALCCDKWRLISGHAEIYALGIDL